MSGLKFLRTMAGPVARLPSTSPQASRLLIAPDAIGRSGLLIWPRASGDGRRGRGVVGGCVKLQHRDVLEPREGAQRISISRLLQYDYRAVSAAAVEAAEAADVATIAVPSQQGRGMAYQHERQLVRSAAFVPASVGPRLRANANISYASYVSQNGSRCR